MTRTRKHIRSVCIDFYFFSILYIIFSFVLFVFQLEQWFLSGLLLLIPTFLMTLIRLRAHSFLSFLLTHLILLFSPLLFLFLPSDVRIIECLVMVALFFHSFSLESKTSSRLGLLHMILSAALSAIFLLIAQSQSWNITVLSPFLFFWTFLSIVVCMIFSQTNSVDESLSILTKNSVTPVNTMLQFNNGAVIGCILLAASAALLSCFLDFTPILSFIGSLLLWLLRSFFQLFPSSSEPEPTETFDELLESAMPDFLTTEANQNPVWMQVAQTFFYYFFFVVVAVVLIALISFGVYQLIKRFQPASDQEHDQKEYIGPELNIQRLIRSRKSSSTGSPFARTQTERIRRKYYQTVRHHIRKGAPITQCDTIWEIAEKLPPEKSIQELTKTYESVRYHEKNMQ